MNCDIQSTISPTQGHLLGSLVPKAVTPLRGSQFPENVVACCLCEKIINPGCLPKPQTMEKIRSRIGSTVITGTACPSCIKNLSDPDSPKRHKSEPLSKVALAAKMAVARDDYEEFAEAFEIIEHEFRDIETEISSLIGKLQKRTELRNLIFRIREEANRAMQSSPRASYFERRIKANKVISKQDIRRRVFEKDGFKCVRCHRNRDLSVDHIVSVYTGGGDNFENLQTLCRRCNSSKGCRPKAVVQHHV